MYVVAAAVPPRWVPHGREVRGPGGCPASLSTAVGATKRDGTQGEEAKRGSEAGSLCAASLLRPGSLAQKFSLWRWKMTSSTELYRWHMRLSSLPMTAAAARGGGEGALASGP